MTKEEISEGNILLAEFMGAKINPKWVDEITYSYEPSNPPTPTACYNWSAETMQYDTSYDWLMPVCKKICSLGYDVEINSNLRRVNIYRNDNGLMLNAPDYNGQFRGNKSYFSDMTDVECLFFALVEFVEWYNDKQKSND